MTPSLLDNELVQKYFSGLDDGCIACNILRAMQQPVKEGELYLAISEYGKVRGPQAFTSSDNWKFHCQWLRLPDAFQKQEVIYRCASCKQVMEMDKPTPSPKDAVEEKIENLTEWARCQAARQYKSPWFEAELRDLVRLSRETE